MAQAAKHTSTLRTAMRRRAPSTLQKLCAKLHAAAAAHNKAVARLCSAEQAAKRAEPKPPSSIEPRKAVRADLPNYMHQHRAIPSTFIRSELASLKRNAVLAEVQDGIKVIRISEAGFPLTDEQKARVRRLEKMLVDAKRYESACAKVQRRFKVDQLERALDVHRRSEEELIAKIEAIRSANKQDVLAKISAYRIDPGMFNDAYVNKMLNEVTRELKKGE
jgi:hypothetical protein